MFLELRRKLINWLAKDDIIVIINTKVYDIVLEANMNVDGKSSLFRRNRVVEHDKAIQDEVAQRIALDKQGITKSGKAFVLTRLT